MKVLQYFGLKIDTKQIRKYIASASKRRGGESAAHRDLKKYVSKHPEVVGLKKKFGLGKEEHRIPSGDSIDVFFEHGDEWVAVEVKSRISSIADICRGLFQCVKYQAVLEAHSDFERWMKSVKVILFLEGKFPRDLVPLRNHLGFQVIAQGKTV